MCVLVVGMKDATTYIIFEHTAEVCAHNGASHGGNNLEGTPMVGITMWCVFPTVSDWEVFPRWETLLGRKYFPTGFPHHGNSH